MPWISFQLGQVGAIFVWILIKQKWFCSRLNNWLVCISLTNGAKLERIKATRLLHRNWWKPEIERWLSIRNIKVLQCSCCYQETQESCSFPCQETSGREPCVVVNRLQRYSTWHRDFNVSNLPRQVLFTITMRICRMLWNPDGSQLVIVETIT